MTITEHAYLLAAIPAGMFLLLALLGRYLPRGGDYLGVLAIGTAFVLMLFVVANFLQHRGGLGLPYVKFPPGPTPSSGPPSATWSSAWASTSTRSPSSCSAWLPQSR